MTARMLGKTRKPLRCPQNCRHEYASQSCASHPSGHQSHVRTAKRREQRNWLGEHG